MRRPTGVALHNASKRHQPAAPPEPDSGLKDPSCARLDPAGQLAGGLMRLDPAKAWQRDMSAVRLDPDSAGGKRELLGSTGFRLKMRESHTWTVADFFP